MLICNTQLKLNPHFMLLGNKIKKLRELRNFTQEFVASEIGITQESYSKIESNRVSPTMERLTKIAKALSIEITDLFKFDENFIFYNSFQNQKESSNYFNSDNISSKEDFFKILLSQHKDEVKALKEEIVFLRSLIKK